MSDSKSVVSVRMSNDMRKEVEKYRVDKDISEADAFRELIRGGLEREDLDQRLERMEKRLNEMITGEELKGDLRRIHNELDRQADDIQELQERCSKQEEGIISKLF